MWMVATDQPYENWIEVFDTELEARTFYAEEVGYLKQLEKLIGSEFHTGHYDIFIAKVDENTKVRY